MQGNIKKKVAIILIAAVVVVLVGLISFALLFDFESSSESIVYSDDSMYYQEVSSKSIVYDEELETYYVNNQILITANEGVSKSKIEELISEYDGEIVGYIEITNDYQIELSGKLTLEDLDEIVEELLDNENIEFAYINEIFEISAEYIPDDSKYDNDDWDESSPDGLNWGLEAIDAMGAWDYLDEMQTVKVGVFDSCFDDSHEDLDDVFVDIINNSTNMSLVDSHGTHVSGIIAAEFDNDTGISGVAPEAKLYGASVYNSFYDDSNNEISFTTLIAVKYCLTSFITAGCKVINVSMSLEGNLETQYDYFGSFLSKLIASNYDFVIVQAAGNDDADAYNTGLFVGIENEDVQDRIIVVGSIYISSTNNYNFSSFSNYGEFVDVVAPGENIYSSIINNSYDYKDGTSMAAPYVSGIAALCYSVNPDLTGDQIKDIIVNSYSTTVKATVSSSKSYTYPLVNAKTAVVTALLMDTGDKVSSTGSVIGTVIGDYDDISVACSTTGSSTSKYITTDADGNFELILQKGVYDIVISSDGYISTTYTNVEVKKNETIYLDDITLVEDNSSQKNGAIFGYSLLYYEYEGPQDTLGDVEVTLSFGWDYTVESGVTSFTDSTYTTTTSENGYYSFEDLPKGCYTAQFTKEGYLTEYIYVICNDDEVKYSASLKIDPSLIIDISDAAGVWGSLLNVESYPEATLISFSEVDEGEYYLSYVYHNFASAAGEGVTYILFSDDDLVETQLNVYEVHGVKYYVYAEENGEAGEDYTFTIDFSELADSIVAITNSGGTYEYEIVGESFAILDEYEESLLAIINESQEQEDPQELSGDYYSSLDEAINAILGEYNDCDDDDGTYVIFDSETNEIDNGYFVIVRYQMTDEEAEERMAMGQTGLANIFVVGVNILIQDGKYYLEYDY